MGSKIVLAGGRGFLGAALAEFLTARGREVVVLTRTPTPGAGVREVAWDGRTVGPWAAELDGAEALVNLAGRSVNCVPTPENRREILESRVNSVRALGEAWGRCARPPGVWVQGSSIGIYGDAGDRICDESTPPAAGYPADVCREWEAAFASVQVPETRRVVLRIGLVLGPGGGALGPLARLARWYLGGAAGHGRQYLSWVHREDMNAIFWEAVTRVGMTGVYNGCSPRPVTNAEFMRELRRALHRPWSPPAPAWVVRLGARWLLQTDADLALTGRRCMPVRLLEQGFKFGQPDLRPALEQIFRRS